MKSYRFTFPDGYSYVVKSSEGLRIAKESALRDYGHWARRGRDPKKAIDLFWALDRFRGQYTIEECEDSPEGGTGKVRRKHSAETKLKMSLAKRGKKLRLGKKWSEESKRRVTGRKLSAVTRKKMSEAHKGQVPWHTGQHWSDEVKQKMRDTQVGKWKWLTDGVKSRCVRMEVAVAMGWWRGRTQSTAYLEFWR